MRTLKVLPVVFMVLLLVSAVSSLGDPDALLRTLTPRGYVSDFAGVFATNDLAMLNGFLKQLEDQTTAEIAVVTVKTLDGGEISDFANRLFKKWGIGQKKKDNGVLLITAVDDRNVWIEVGYGLEGAIPDARAGRILDEQVVPEFKEGRHASGLIRGAQALAGIVAAESGITLTNLPPGMAAVVPPVAPPVVATTSQGSPLAPLVFFGLFFGMIGFLVFAAKKGWIKPTKAGGGRIGRSSGGGGGGGGGSGGGFGGGSSGGGGAGRSW